MSALTADVHHPRRGATKKIVVKAIGADTFFAGALIFADSANGKAQAVPAANDHFLGIVVKQVVATAADDLIEVYSEGEFSLAFAGAAEADVGDAVVIDASGAKTDNPEDIVSAADATIAAGDILVGRCVGLNEETAAQGWVELHKGGGVANVLGWL